MTPRPFLIGGKGKREPENRLWRSGVCVGGVMLGEVGGDFSDDEFLDEIGGGGGANADGGVLEYQGGTAIVLRIVGVGNAAGDEAGGKGGGGRLPASIVALEDHRHGDGVESPRAVAARSFIEVARILFQERRQNRAADERAGDEIREPGSVALSVTLRAMPVSAEGVLRLLDAGNRANQYERDGIGRALPGQLEFLPGPQRDGVGIVSDVEIREHAEHALLFLLLNLHFRQFLERRRDPHFHDGGGELQLDHGNDVDFTGMQDAGNCLRCETRRGNRELKCAGRNVGESELAIAIGDYFDDFLRRGLAVKRELYVSADDGGSAFIRYLAADGAGRDLVGLLRGGQRLRLSECERWNNENRDAETDKRQKGERRAS